MYDEVERAAKGGDPAKISRAFADMKDRFAGTTYAAQAGLLSAKALYEKGQVDQAKVPLEWVANSAADESYRAIAKLRLSSILFESKEFEALALDRRGDILLAQGKRDEAKAAFEKAYKAMDERSEYRRLLEIKLNSLGMDMSPKVADAAVSGAAPAPATAPVTPAPAATPAAAAAAPAASAAK
jgi:predicted negative regulator of RcsB-dependent stress response